MVKINLDALVSFLYYQSTCKLLNLIRFFNCLASRFGNVGTLHLVKNSTDLDWLLNEGISDPYIVALTPNMFTR